MKYFISLLLALCAVFARAAEIELIPKGRPFAPTFADPREIRMALALQNDARLTAMVGNYFSLVGFAPSPAEVGWVTHVGLEGGGYFTMKQENQRFPLESVDGLIGLYVDSAKDEWAWQARYTHVSAHLADGSADTPIAYSRETLIGRLSYAISPEARVYGGVHWIAHAIPSSPALAFQLGGAYFLSDGHRALAPYAAFDLKYRRESPYDPSLSLQLGLALNNPPEAYRSFRFFYSFYTGADPRGQFHTSPYHSHSLGIEMQI